MDENKQPAAASKKSLIALILALGGIVCLFLSWIPMDPVTWKGKTMNMHSSINVLFSVLSLGLAIVALVMGIIAKKRTDKPGKAIAAKIIGILTLIVSLLSLTILSVLYFTAEYVKDPVNSTLGQAFKDSPEDKKKMDKAIDDLFGIKEESSTTLPSESSAETKTSAEPSAKPRTSAPAVDDSKENTEELEEDDEELPTNIAE